MPNEDKKTLRAVYAYAADQWWDFCIDLGDFVDFNCISRFTEDRPGAWIGESIWAYYDEARRVLHEQVNSVRTKNPKCQVIFLEGNHENRIERYIEKHPELGGGLSNPLHVDKALGFKELKIKWVRCADSGAFFRLGKAIFHHGRWCNKYHAMKHVDYFGTNIFYGHTHDVQEFAKILHGKDSTIKGKSLGCLCRYDQVYIRGNPTNWQQSFTVFYFYPDGYFQELTVPIFKHRFVGPTNGKVYDGRKL